VNTVGRIAGLEIFQVAPIVAHRGSNKGSGSSTHYSHTHMVLAFSRSARVILSVVYGTSVVSLLMPSIVAVFVPFILAITL